MSQASELESAYNAPSTWKKLVRILTGWRASSVECQILAIEDGGAANGCNGKSKNGRSRQGGDRCFEKFVATVALGRVKERSDEIE